MDVVDFVRVFRLLGMASQESRPLLAGERESGLEAHHEPVPRSNNHTPLPKIQFGALCFLRTLDPMAFTQIFPYINEFMTDLHVTRDLSQIGFYSGLVVGGEFFHPLACSAEIVLAPFSRKVHLLLHSYSQFIHWAFFPVRAFLPFFPFIMGERNSDRTG
jgi:hypothetical protein